MEAPPIGIRARVSASASGTSDNVVQLAGGGVAMPSVSRAPVSVSSVEPSFGVAGVSASSYEEDGAPAEQAGGHPYGLTFGVQLNSVSSEQNVHPVGDAKTFEVQAPAGLVGDPQAVAQCPREAFDGVGNGGVFPECPTDSQVGIAAVGLGNQGRAPEYLELPIYNLVPPAGVPAQFGFSELGIYATLDASLRTGGDYGITEKVSNTAQRAVIGTSVTLWGVPASPAHDHERGEQGSGIPCEEAHPRSCPSGLPARPFLSNPDVCGAPMTWQLETDDWLEPATFLKETVDTLDNLGEPATLSGCEAQNFAPSFTATPDRTGAEEPTGLHVDLHVPQHYEDPSSPAEATVKTVSVTLPEGLTVSPSSADGLQACSEAQIGLHTAEVPSCPSGSEIGTDEVTTPLVAQPLHGAVYLAQQEHNPFSSLLAIYIVAEGSGALVKLAGHVEANPVTGQLTTTVADVPDVPFEDSRLDFFSGPRAPLMTPATRGTFQSESTLAPWSGTTPVALSSPFAITQGAGGGACAHTPAEEPNSPSFTAGTEAPVAGAYSPLVIHLERGDGSQDFSQINVTLPPGATGKLAGIPQCSDAQIAAAQALGRTGSGCGRAGEPVLSAVSRDRHRHGRRRAGPGPVPCHGPGVSRGPV